MTPEVLVVGAGPTGLMVACTLRRFGVGVRIVDRRPGPATEPKALVLWSGALEVLRRTGVASEVVKRALPLAAATYWAGGSEVGSVRFGGLRGTAYPGPLCLPQTITERALLDRLTDLGGAVEWGVELVAARSDSDAAHAELRTSEGSGEEVAVPWLVAADGTHSRIRSGLGIPFEGRTFERTFMLGDGLLVGPAPDREAQYHLTPEGVMVLVPLPDAGHRIFFDMAPEADPGGLDDEVLGSLLAVRGRGRLGIRRLWWRSRFRIHARVAAAFRQGRVFLAGDAAHSHSPAGGQGLNTGLQDGFDLGWKLAAAVQGADPRLLDSYEIERRPPAIRAVRNSDRQTRLWLLKSAPARLVRDVAMRQLSRGGILERSIVPKLAQLDLDHSQSPAVIDLAGGDRLPREIRPGRRIPDSDLLPVAGRSATSLHDYLSEGHHCVVIVGDGRFQGVVERVMSLLRARPEASLWDVLWIRPRKEADPSGRVVQAEPGCGVALAPDGGLPCGSGWMAYVRPDGVVGARAGMGRAEAFLALGCGIGMDMESRCT